MLQTQLHSHIFFLIPHVFLFLCNTKSLTSMQRSIIIYDTCTHRVHYFGIHSIPLIPQQHVKDPSHSAKSARGRLQLDTQAAYICGFKQNCKPARGCVVYTTAQRWQQFHVTIKQCWKYTTLVDISNILCKATVMYSFRVTCNYSIVSLPRKAWNSTIQKYQSN